MNWKSSSRRIWFGIRFRLTLAFLVCFGIMASLGLVLLRATLIPSFTAVEQAMTIDDVARVVEGFDTELSHLALMNKDWANWDDMYQFAENPDEKQNIAFLKSNLSTASLVNASLSLVVIFDRTGQQIGYRSVAPHTGEERDIGLFSPEKKEFLTRFIHPPTGGNCGLMESKPTLLMVCWRPILRTNSSGPAVGTLVMGRDLDKDVLLHIREQTKLSFDLLSASSAGNGGEWWKLAAPKYLQENRVYAIRRDSSITLDYQLLDLVGKPVANVHMNLPRELMAQGQLVFSRTAIQLGLIAATTGVLLLAAMQVWFVRPLARLQRAVANIRSQKAWQSRVTISGQDEISLLSEEINGLLGVIGAQVQDLEALSMTDSLTGLPNRRAFDLRLSEDLQRVKRTGNSLSLLMLDIDYFKQYNDHYGHPAGDRALQALAQVMADAARRDLDLDARIGGEEFAVLLPDTNEAGARRVAEALQAELVRRAIPHAQSEVAEWITVSIGITTATAGDELPSQLMERADQALYVAKKNGRNRIESV